MKTALTLLAFLFAGTFAFSACEEKSTSTDPDLLTIRGVPQKKMPLFSKRKIIVTSSSTGQGELLQGKRTIKNYDLKDGDNIITIKQRKGPDNYRLIFQNDDGLTTKSAPWRVRYPTLETGSKGREVSLLHKNLRHLGYKNAPRGNVWNEYTSLAVLAFRKSNGLDFDDKASPRVLRMLLRGRGAFPLREKRAGKYVEVDLSRQVMVLAKDGKPQMTYHISSGAPITPSDLGRYTFYSKLPGYNSLGMYYSVFYNRGEATHGYVSVPDYPASHGCIRNPIPSSIQIYNWIPLGTPIWVY